MRDIEQIFHLAIPSHDLDLAVQFYGEGLNQVIARRYDDRVTVNFFGDQVVCHLAPNEIDKKPQMYPRHFGITFKYLKKFEDVYQLAKGKNLEFYQDLFVRFEGIQEEHRTFFLKDYSNNLLEFKYYKDSTMMY